MMIKPNQNRDSKDRRPESTSFLVCSSYFSSCFKICVCLSNKSRMFVMKSAFLV